jgi:beta-mannosidase
MTTWDPGRKTISLNGDRWRLALAPEEAELLQEAQFLPATVPGDVRLDLLRAGLLPNPHFGQNSRGGQWIDEQGWWLVRGLEDLDLPPDRRIFLRLHGVDYLSDVYFKGHHLGQHEGMFSSQLYELSGLLTGSADEAGIMANTLAVHIAGTAHLPALKGGRAGWRTRWTDRLEQRLGAPNRWPHRRSTFKCQMGFGWDFAPDLPSLGLWDDAELIVAGDVFIRSLWTRPIFRAGPGGAVQLQVTLELDAVGHYEVEIGLNLYGLNCDAPPLIELFPLTLQAGQQRVNLELSVPEPQLWWPWDQGEPNLYRLLVTVRRRAELLDSLSQTVGLRHIRLESNPDAPADALPWVFVVNGQRVFLRGANWVPASLFPGEVTAEDYRALLELAREANINALRVWGGGLREKAAFYDDCDRMGLLVWQEFPLACAFLTRHPRSEDYLALARQEASAIVRTLRHHPSVALWCGGNEFNPTRDRAVVEALAGVVAAEDPARPFIPVSPANGDRHNWHVWHGYAPVSAYRQEVSQFASEFGLQAPPVEESLRRFIPEEELWPPGPSWAHHNANWAKLWRYAAPFLDGRSSPKQVSLKEFLAASQRAQAHGLQVAIEHHRRRKYACGGCMVWQFNSPWPTIEWAILDYFRRPKLAYQMVQRLYAPVLISLDYPLIAYGEGSKFCPTVWAINDYPKALTDCYLEITLESADGTFLNRFEQTLNLDADSAEVAARFCWTLPAGAQWVRCHLRQGEKLLSFNEYDLGFYDPRQPSRWHRLWSRLGERLLGRE